jgi:hypothetical protein
MKCCALVDFALGPSPSAMGLNDSLDNGKADASSLEILPRMESLEYAEQFVDMFHVETRAVVGWMVANTRVGDGFRLPGHGESRWTMNDTRFQEGLIGRICIGRAASRLRGLQLFVIDNRNGRGYCDPQIRRTEKAEPFWLASEGASTRRLP